MAPPKPNQIVAPTPISGNDGEYMCPYTQDDVVAPWVDKAINASMGSTLGKTAGAYLGSELCENVPLIGGLLGSTVGEHVGRKIAIESCGGWEYIKSTSDLSFNSIDDLAVWLYATKSDNEHYDEVLKATWEIYPKLEDRYWTAIRNATTI
jgi:hypothetical protein